MTAAIIKAERVTHPPVRFIGKRFDAYPDWGLAWENDWFGVIEKAGKTAAINDGSYCVLVGAAESGVEFYLGEFMEAGTPVPDGFDFADLPGMSAGLVYIKGKPDEVYALTAPDKRGELQAALAEAGAELPAPDAPPKRWLSFERDNCPRWTDPDPDGNRILDYAVYL
ncbi:MAG: hypothetical protein LBS90_05090 [Oscillospiraceae bacterium]|jgi:hypothetical protein|nr:hypothetical protein [Oscillospiraceae bacterium]